MLKRFGRVHDPAGPDGTKPGELVVECPACLHPGRNLPLNWDTAPPDVKWLYTLFLMIDANFRAKSKDRGFNDIELAPRWSYYVEESKYRAHVKAAHARKRKELYSCSAEHSAVLKANQHREGYLASGLGAVLCTRHGLVRKNGAGDLQLGEGYANMDYLYFSTLLGVILVILISYDIVCQWYKNLFSRMVEDFPEEMWINQSRWDSIQFAIPKKHWKVHGSNPSHSRFSLNYLPHVGRTYGEGIKSHWSHMNPLSLSTREMSPGITFLRALEEAHDMCIKQDKAFEDCNATFDTDVNEDPDQPDPYEEPIKSVSTATVKLELAQEEEKEAAQGLLPEHEVTPGVFLQVGLELEDQHLEEVRRSRRILAGISDYTRKNIAGTGQRAVLRMRGLYAQFEKKQGRSVARYRDAHKALLSLDPEASWTDTYKVLQDGDLRGPRSDDPSESFGRYSVSWIWLTPRANPNDSADARDTTSPERAQEFQLGLSIYAEKQAAVFENLAARCASFWVNYLKKLGPLPSWIAQYKDNGRKVRPRKFSSALGKDRSEEQVALEDDGTEDENDAED
ncbi:hypothetical protein BD310DRAFT_906324 [Dichomitus squalens]|uniref:CxC2-like cysteine cluster KDZ transposase-associated domain-containing protein n=1 Tax=Dichomitus squalens TaxID=114155 RepID=A0A4Q9PWI9_9APHY|nr:hypothetical protein BD310DRAFT_906324 [Dichomitus squalens]